MDPNPNDPNFNPGGIKDIPDNRDFRETARIVSPYDFTKGYDIEEILRARLNNPQFKIPVKNQGGSFSCGGQAWGYYGQVLEALKTGTFEEDSAKYIYAQTAVPGGGSAGRTNCDLVVNKGWGREILTPSYENGNPPTEAFITRVSDITQAAHDDAKGFSAFSYLIETSDIDAVAWAIEANQGVILGVTGQSNGTWHSSQPKPPTGENGLWNHWVYAGKTGIVNGKRAIKILNSWGNTIGDGGWQWIDEDYFASGRIFSVWIIKTSHTFSQNLEFGMEGQEVKNLQLALRKLGHFKYGSITGFYGNITMEAVKSFQKTENIVTWGNPTLTGYGRCGPKTRARLNTYFAV
jgi:hypothetical protein